MDTLQNQAAFNLDPTMCIYENMENTHIWNVESDCIPEGLIQLKPSDTTGVATTRSKYLSPHSIGSAKSSWTDDA